MLEPILKEKVWGGRRLEGYGKQLPPDGAVGESWEVADLGSTSPDGGGGDEARSIISNGDLAGDTLHRALRVWGKGLLGATPPTEDGGFPLLVKFLDAGEHLSVQVHPTAAYVGDHPEADLKTESWYVIEAEPGSSIFKGVAEGTTREDLARAVREKTLVDLLDRVEARAGDFHHLPAGTVHALGAGVLVAEIQTPSDTTYRLYDWTSEYGRSERPLHVEQAVANAILEPGDPPYRASEPHATLVDTAHYVIELLKPGDTAPYALRDARCAVVMVLSGTGSLGTGAGSIDLDVGETCVVPAAISGEATVALDASSAVLVAHLGSG